MILPEDVLSKIIVYLKIEEVDNLGNILNEKLNEYYDLNVKLEVCYNENSCVYQHIDNKYHGKFINIFYGSNCVRIQEFIRNKKHGKYASYYNYDSRNIKTMSTFRNGVLEETSFSYYNNGKILSVIEYEKGIEKDVKYFQLNNIIS